MNSAPYLSISAPIIQAREQARRAANKRPVCLFPSYREAELRGYYSLKRLRQMGLEVREREHWNYLYMVATPYGNLPVYSREQASGVRAPNPVPGPGEARRSTRSESRSFFPRKSRRQADVQPYVGKIAHRQDRQGGPNRRKRRGALAAR